ncbi:MAG: glycogen debranching enzyme N-terminal domain-containing protein [Acidobacteria bacterium]|nr:glycogen debranching enzyme N-terminal domain-containing protein [Acidobacteriota bacterium]
MIRFDQDICSNLDAATSREWLETNGLGGFASSTIVGLNTRRYHGLLLAATKPPVGRMLLLSKLEETLVLGERRFELSANQYPGVVHPQGYRYLRQFRLDPFPVFVYEVDGVELEKSLFMVQGENTTVVQYWLRAQKGAPPQCQLEVRPLIAFRDYHSTTRANDSLNRYVETAPGRATVVPYAGAPALHFAHDAAEFESGGDWYRNFEYAVERERGLDFQEDLYSPFVLRFDLARRPQATLVASTEVRDTARAAEYREQEVARRRAVLATSRADDDFVRALVAAAGQYIVARGDQKTVIAGYPWFADWGRDTMISLPGLCLTTGRSDVARQVLLAFARVVDRGMLPNRFPDAGEAPEYNTVDATLWFFEAARAYRAATGDDAFVRENLYPVLADIIDWHIRGTRYGIRVEEDGLLASGEPGVQLTWMDAKVGDWVITPRYGKAVEIQALWYNALCVMEELARDFGDAPGRKRYTALAENAKAAFNGTFWNDATGCLYDVVASKASGGARDGSLRPNQILAVSLPYSMLPAERAQSVVTVVERELLTPYGLRSLAPGDPQYRPRYEGDSRSRDSAYHQGTVWPWLMGPFVTAYCKVNGHSKQAREQARKWLEPLHAHLSEAGLGQISEVFDARAPHRPGGCFAQAWSVAEVLRALVDDVLQVKSAPAAAPKATRRAVRSSKPRVTAARK